MENYILQLEADLSLDDDLALIDNLTEGGKRPFESLKLALPFHRMRELAQKDLPPFVSLGAKLLNEASVQAFTASIAGSMLKKAGGKFVLAGTRKERQRGVSQEALKAKVACALSSGLEVIFGLDLTLGMKEQLELLEGDQPSIIVHPDPKLFSHYIPVKRELEALFSSLPEEVKKCRLYVELPDDLKNTPDALDGLPFAGAFFSIAGVYPHCACSVEK